MPRPSTLHSVSQIERAKRLAQLSVPLVAELYETHIQACEENQGRGNEARASIGAPAPPSRVKPV
jgi:hypothetical protein